MIMRWYSCMRICEGERGEDAERGIKTAVVNGLEMDDYK